MIYKSARFRDRCGRLRHVPFTITAALLLLVCIDYLSGFFFKNSTEAHVTTVRVDHNSLRRAIVVLPGYLMSGSTVANAFKSYLLPGNALVAVDYAERGVDLVAIYSKVRAALDSLKPQAVTFYGASMGGLIAVRLAEIYARDGMPFKKITLILDTAPMRAADVKRPAWLFGLSCLYQGGIVSSAVLALLVVLNGFPPATSSANPKLVGMAHKEGTWVGMPAAASQACFIRNAQPLKGNEVNSGINRVVYLHAHSSDEDPLIDVNRSIADWRIIFPDLRVISLSERSGQWHIPLVEQPGETAKAVQAPY